ncbi:L,D-transpeptidase family protein [Algicella marina]|uniref:L,D-transpeptidase family protein n=1 Tax=Algicella marina TaxID=2683284 RepID=A0A6P1SZN1_9RHOB|nr:L,D-transpeptidase family protein [Algicella marina]QHQ35207.1 L,D-transpeptidase family protein [Algicella marina]
MNSEFVHRFPLRRLAASFVALIVAGSAYAQDLATTEAATVGGEVVSAVMNAEPELVLTREARAFRTALETAGVSDSLFEYYEQNGFVPIWDESRKAALLDVLLSADEHGLPKDRYGIAELAELFSDGSVAEAEAEIAAGKAFLTYARDVSSGLLEPRSVDRDIAIKPPRPEAVALLAELEATTDVAGFFRALAPAHPQYAKLQEELIRLKDIIAAGDWGAKVSGGPSIKAGNSSPRVVDIRSRLSRISGQDYGDSPLYDDLLIEAVKAFQLTHGLNDDGVAGPMTLEAINASAEDRLKQVLVNLERQRWLNVERGARHVYVNQADFSVSVIQDGETIFWSRTVIGKNKHRTQEFNDTMTHMVVNPTWHVPRSITTEEMLPKLKRNPGALGSTYQVMTRNGTRVNPKFVNFSKFSQSNFPFIIKQKPGGGNALGRVKFMFPNQYNIYLHDTPSKSLFNRDARAYSHGCVRVQKPFELARVLLAPQSDNPDALFQSVLNSGSERHLNLEQPLPIYLSYNSAWVAEDGTPQYRADIYGRDARVFQALENAGVSLGVVEG